jgi:hypothetical protein
MKKQMCNAWLRMGVCALWLFAAGPLAAQAFALDWFTVSGGGGESSGGDFELSATIGQPDAGNLSGGDFDIAGGFWSIITTVETPGAPLLSVRSNGGNIVISWPESESIGFGLEQTSTLANPSGSTTWSAVNVAPSASNGVKSVQLPMASGNRFYRLHKP